MIVGDGEFKYEVEENWPKKIPEYWTLGQCADIDVGFFQKFTSRNKMV